MMRPCAYTPHLQSRLPPTSNPHIQSSPDPTFNPTCISPPMSICPSVIPAHHSVASSQLHDGAYPFNIAAVRGNCHTVKWLLEKSAAIQRLRHQGYYQQHTESFTTEENYRDFRLQYIGVEVETTDSLDSLMKTSQLQSPFRKADQRVEQERDAMRALQAMDEARAELVERLGPQVLKLKSFDELLERTAKEIRQRKEMELQAAVEAAELEQTQLQMTAGSASRAGSLLDGDDEGGSMMGMSSSLERIMARQESSKSLRLTGGVSTVSETEEIAAFDASISANSSFGDMGMTGGSFTQSGVDAASDVYLSKHNALHRSSQVLPGLDNLLAGRRSRRRPASRVEDTPIGGEVKEFVGTGSLSYIEAAANQAGIIVDVNQCRVRVCV